MTTPASGSEKCACEKTNDCPRVPQERLRRAGGSEGIARIDRPFAVCSSLEIRHLGHRVACQYHSKGLAPLFEQAALLVNDPGLINDKPANGERGTEILTESDRTALREEATLGFWDQPWPFRTTCYMLFTAALVQGWNQTATNGANVCFMDHLIDPDRAAGIDCAAYDRQDVPQSCRCLGGTAGTEMDADQGAPWKYGLVSAAPFLFSVVGSLLSDPLNEILMGRRRAILVSATLIFASAIASAYMETWWTLLICRAVLGIGMGGKAAVVPVFLAEIAPAHLRGTLIMNWQVFDALGIFSGFTANLIAASAGAGTAWKWQVASSALPAFAVMVGVMLVSWDSPRFQMKHEQEHYRRYQNKRRRFLERRERRAKQRAEAARAWRARHGTFGEDNTPVAPGDDDLDVDPPSILERLWDGLYWFYGPDPRFAYHSTTYDTLKILRGNRALAAKELVFTHCQLVVQQLSAMPDAVAREDDVDLSLYMSQGWWHWKRRVVGLFSEDYLRKELIAAAVLMTSQQMTGVNALIFYSARLFSPAAYTDAFFEITRGPVWLSWAIGLLNFLFALPAYWWIESRGRRWLVLATLPVLSIITAAAAGSYQLKEAESRRIAVGFWTLLFMVFYSPALGPVPFTLSAEIFPLEYRMVGMSMVVAWNLLLGGIIILIVPIILDQSDKSILLGAFAISNILAWCLSWVFVREPEARPWSSDTTADAVNLEEVCKIYLPDHTTHIDHQWNRKWVALRSVGDFLRGRRTLRERSDYFPPEETL